MAFQFNFARTIIYLALVYFVCVVSAQTSSPPNIIFVLADDLGWDDVGFHGSEIKTPNIDRLAYEGVILSNYYVQPVCTPTRSAILTGRYPIHTGLQHYVIVGSQPYGLPLNVSTLPQQLKDIGYKTHAVGKWHLGFCSDAYLPESRGFDSFLGFYTGHSDYLDHYTHDGTFMGYDLHKKKMAMWNQSEVYSTELFTAQAKSIIESHDKKSPLFMYVAHQAVHAGNFDVLQAPRRYIQRFDYITNVKRKIFAGMVSALDDSVGEIYQSLVDANMADNTVIVFSTDNGGPTNGYDGNAACNWPLRGCKGTLWQGGVRGVGFVHSPLLQKKGYINTNLMHASDWTPTLLSIATNHRVELHEQAVDIQTPLSGLDGIDQWDVISHNTTTIRKEVLLNIDPIDKQEAIIIGDFKLIHGKMAGGNYDGWYPPPPHNPVPATLSQDQGCSDPPCHIHKKRPSSDHDLDVDKEYMEDNADIDEVISMMNRQYETLKQELFPKSHQAESSSLLFASEKNILSSDVLNQKLDSMSGRGDIVKCGIKPVNASIDCVPGKQACLYNIRDDPCEYVNLAHFLPSVAQILQERIADYRATMLPPANKPIDPKGNPQVNGGVWQPWL